MGVNQDRSLNLLTLPDMKLLVQDPTSNRTRHGIREYHTDPKTKSDLKHKTKYSALSSLSLRADHLVPITLERPRPKPLDKAESSLPF